MSVLPQVDEVFQTAMLPGGVRTVRCVAVHPFGTMDVETLDTGDCYRITGLNYILEHDPLNLL